MSGQATTTANPITTYGSGATKNQVRPGGDLGNKSYYPVVDAKTGRIDVYRYTRQRGGNVQTKIGSIPRGGNFNVESKANGDPIANSAEILHFGSATGKQKFRDNAKQVVTREWKDAGSTSQPPPDTVIFGDNSINTAYGTKNSSGEVFEDTRVEEGGKPTADDLANARLKELKEAGNNSVLNSSTKPNTSLGAGEVIIYPQTIRSSAGGKGQDYIKLQMLEYSPKGFASGSAANLSGIGSRKKNRKGLGSVILPIPGGIRDANLASWGGDNMDPVAVGMANVALSTIMEGVAAGGSAVADAFKGAAANSADIKKALGTSIAGMASKTGAQVLQRTQGAILNPNMELLFNNPGLRQFNFSWKLAPRSAAEARAVIQIIRFFKQGMAPIRQAPNLFLKSPNTFQITYHHKFDEHKFLNKIKECALTNCGIDYTPDGNYATFEDGVMTAYNMTLAFNELDPIYSDDYEDLPNNQIGF